MTQPPEPRPAAAASGSTERPDDHFEKLGDLPGLGLRRRPLAAVRRKRRAIVAASLAAALILVGIGGAVALQWSSTRDSVSAAPSPSPSPTPTPTATPSPTPTPTPTPEPDPAPEQEFNLDEPSSITVVVNKQRPLNPIEWEPDDLVLPQGITNTNGQPLRAEAAQALEAMFAEAAAAGVPFIITSAYRSYGLQADLFDDYAARDGVEAAETYSARPGHSEHQTGLAVDLDDGGGCAFQACFGETATGLWLRENAHRFGFILRYDQGEEPIVGYVYEPWHFRYIGTDIALDMKNSGEKNLETYFGLPAAPTY